MKKQILISVYDMEIGGIERSLINMLESFDYEKYEVDLLICHHSGDLMSFLPDNVNVLPQIESYTVFRKPVSQCLKEGHYTLSVVRILSKTIANIKSKKRNLEEGAGYIQMQLASKYSRPFIPRLSKKYDVAISYAWPHDLVANKVKAIKKIAWIHTDYSKLEIDNNIDLNSWNQFQHIISVSDECKNSFLAQYPILKDKVKTIENINSPVFIKNMAQEKIESNELNPSNFNIISVGRLSYVKGFDLAVKALRKLHDKGLTNIKWYVVGFGGYEEELCKIIVQNRLRDSFILLGKKKNPYNYMQMCDIYVQPSRYEGKAVTVTEAKILGKPIIITNYPTSKSQIYHRVDGLICDLSVEGIANGIEELYVNTDLRSSLVNQIQDVDYSNRHELKKLYSLIG